MQSCSKIFVDQVNTVKIPWRSLEISLNPTTRAVSLTLTPYQSDSGASVFQFVLWSQLAPSVSKYRATNASRSVDAIAEVGLWGAFGWDLACGRLQDVREIDVQWKKNRTSHQVTRDRKPVTVGCITFRTPFIPHGCLRRSHVISQITDTLHSCGAVNDPLSDKQGSGKKE